jgi:CRISPR/Cas system Type II protein with McrA/HNH and RuvC-like nuclease domain
MRKGNYAVDHFIPWSMYPSDTGHNFVLADASCNAKKSNLLASDEFLYKWRERNHVQDLVIIDRISILGFLTDKDRSHKVAEWAYAQAEENGYLLWSGKL